MRLLSFWLFCWGLLSIASLGQSIGYREFSALGPKGSISAPIPFSAVAAKWSPDITPVVQVRGSVDGVSWTNWRALSADSDSGLPSSALTWLGEDIRFFEWESSSPAVVFVFIDPGKSVERGKGSPRRSVEASSSKPPVISRTDWGCPDGQNYRGTPTYTTVTHLIVHHTADGPVSDFAAWVRAIWTFHVFSNKWDDIGYNYVVAPDGRVFEGRAGGDNVMGAHFSGQNSGTMGVSMLGTYTKTLPTAEALVSLESILAWKADQRKIDPLGVRLHPGTRLYLMNISGHRDANASPFASGTTECPGDAFYPTLPTIRANVAARLDAIHTLTLLLEDAETGAGAGWNSNGMWHVTHRKPAGHAWWFGSEATGTYDGQGAPVSGTLESPSVDVNGEAFLTFRTWYETENPTADWDKKLVEVNVDGGEWRQLDQLIGIERQWVTRSYPLPSKGSVRVRFRFDSVDATLNGFEGWYIDDIRITLRQ